MTRDCTFAPQVVASAAVNNGVPKPAAAAKKVPAAERPFTNTLK